MDVSLEDLTLRFEVDVTAACLFCEKIICGDQFNSLSEFIEYHRSLSPPNCCTRSWKALTVTAICKQCMKNKNSCICIDCYLKGNHKGHDVTFALSDVGNCDCGDASAWAPLGFCSNHFNHKSEDLPNDLSNLLIKCFTAALSNYQFLASYKTEQFTEICQWIKKFSDINGAFKSIVAHVFSEKLDLSAFLLNFHQYSVDSIMSALDLISSITSNPLINKAITLSTLNILPNYMWMFFSVASEPLPKKKPMEQLIYLLKILPYGFMHGNVTEMFNDNYDWVPSISKTIRLIFDFCTRDYNSKVYERTRCKMIFTLINDLISDATESTSQIENVKRFSSIFFKDLNSIEGQCKFERKFNEKEDDVLKKETTSIHLEFYLSDIVRKICNIDGFEEENCVNSILSFIENNILNDNFDANKEKPILFRSTLCPGVFGTESLSLHVSFMQLLIKKQNKQDFMRQLYNIEKNVSFDDFLLSFSLLPIRLFSVHSQSAFGLFEHNCNSFLLAIQSFTYKGNIFLRLMPLFGLIQMMLGIVEDKEYAVNSILHIIGIYDIDETDSNGFTKEFNDLILFFLFFLSNIVTDRICMNLDLRQFEARSLAIDLEKKSYTVTEIENLYWPELVGYPFFKTVVDEIAEKFVIENETKFKLKSESFWMPVVPFASIKSFFSSITPFIQKKKEQLLPFPELPDEENDLNQGLNLRGLLMTKTTFAVIFQVMSLNAHNSGSNIFSLHLALNLLILMKKISFENSTVLPHQNDDDFLVAENLKELIEIIPDDFNVLLTYKIKYRNNPPESFIDLLEHLGAIGAHVLSIILPKVVNDPTFDINKGINDEETERLKKKKAAQIAKEKALKQLQAAKVFNFDDIEEDENENNLKKKKKRKISASMDDEVTKYSDEEEEEEEEEYSESNICTICQEKKSNELVWFPMTVFQSSLANIETPNNAPISNISASICTHTVHSNCIKNNKPGRNFQCSSDRCIKNCILPKIPDIKKMISRSKKLKTSVSNLYQTEIESFMAFFAAVSQIDREKTKNRTFSLSTLLEMFVGILTSIEFRDRSNATFARKPTNILILKYLFRVIWLIEQISAQKVCEKSLPIWILVSQLITSEDPSSSVDTFATIIKKLLNGDELIKFERQMAILKLSIFTPTYHMNDIIIPNPSSLRRNITNNIEFPNMFLEFILPKYNSIPVDKYWLEIGICLITGSLVYLRNNPETPSYAVSLNDHLDNCGGLCPILMLTEFNATAVFLYTKTFNTKVKLRPFYLTKDGDENIGLDSSGLPLFFRKDVYERMLDLIFSGEWLWSLDAKDHIDCVFDNDAEYDGENND
ncbi:hypothetical protein M9Y10_002800 [Tritrichomonas musculus]|uniref:E3 ubiquitin-protein ligase n=1 Tax=Tritrichomonas musculus TaxID=1915356 RepID=A0ABR2LAW5_9EUKA